MVQRTYSPWESATVQAADFARCTDPGSAPIATQAHSRL